MGTPANIVVGFTAQAVLKAASYGESESQAKDLGFIKGGLSIEHEETAYDIKVDQILGAVDKVTTDETLKIKVSLAEATLENIALALGVSAPAADVKEISLGGKTQSICKTLFITVKGTGAQSRKYTFWKCRPNGKTAQSYKRDGETLVEIEFDVLADASKPSGQRFGKIEDITAD